MRTSVPAATEPPATLSNPSPPAGRGSQHAALMRQVKQEGLLDRRPGYYTAKIALTLGLLAAGWVAFVLLGDSWYQLLTAAFLAVVFTQLAFVAHDAGHGQIFPTRRANDRLGLTLGNLLLGFSYGWWMGKHTRHHANPNNVDRDPDVNLEAVAFTTDQARAKRGLTKFVARYQAWLFFPLLMLEAVELHFASIRALLRGESRLVRLEAGLLLAHTLGYLTIVALVLPPLQALVFILVQQGLFGLYLGCSFAPNHKGMPMLTKRDELDYLRRQVLTSRNVRGNWFVDAALGGLNYQIEHHLFPSMPRPNLRRAQATVRAFCLDHGVAYTETGVWDSYAQVLRHLDLVGAPLRPVSVE
jgi:fatty acid desaturase